MKTMERTARKAVGILALSAMIPLAAWAADAPPAKGYRTPPQLAFDACAGKNAGDKVQLTTPGATTSPRSAGSSTASWPRGPSGRAGGTAATAAGWATAWVPG